MLIVIVINFLLFNCRNAGCLKWIFVMIIGNPNDLLGKLCIYQAFSLILYWFTKLHITN